MRYLISSPHFVTSVSMTTNTIGLQHWPVGFGNRRVIRAEKLLGTEVVERAIEEAGDDYRRSVQLTRRHWDIFLHGTLDERNDLRKELHSASAESWTQEEWQMKRLQEEQEESRQQAEMEEWREQHQAARDAARQRFRAEEFMRECVTIAEQVAREPDEHARGLQMAALAAKILPWLATSGLPRKRHPAASGAARGSAR